MRLDGARLPFDSYLQEGRARAVVAEADMEMLDQREEPDAGN